MQGNAETTKPQLSYRTSFLGVCTALALLFPTLSDALAIEVTDAGQRPELLRGKVTGMWAKANGALRGVVSEFRSHLQRGGAAELFRPSNTSLRVDRGRVVIDAVATTDAGVLLDDLRRFGLRNASRYGIMVSGLIPIGTIERAVQLTSLRSIAASFKPLNNAGTVTSEGVQAMNAVSVQATYTGAGITVGVLSDSFDQKNGYATDVSSGDLPPNVNVLDDTANCGSACSDEGRGMMQLIYDVAPGVNLAFHTAFGNDGMAGFATGIEELAAAGSDIIVDDVIYFAEPMFQDGIIAQAVNNVVNSGKAYFSSAGNFARESYQSSYVPSGETLWVGSENRGQLHDFGQAQSGPSDFTQSVTIPALPEGTLVTLVLQWDEPFASAGGPGATSDVDVYLWDPNNNNTIVASSLDDNLQIGDAIEVLQFRVRQTTSCDIFEQLLLGITCVAPGTYDLAVSLFTGPQPSNMKYIIFRRDIQTEYETHSSTLFGHANAEGAEAVGAAFYQATPFYCDTPPFEEPAYDDCDEADGVTTARLEPFSAAGGTPILFDKSGIRLGSPITWMKPGVVGPDGSNTTFFISDSSRDPDTFPNFFGTSASAPHVAGVGALMLEAKPDLSPGEMYATLRNTALNMNPRPEGPSEEADGFDFDTGYGFVQADAAVAAVIAPPPANNPPVAINNTATVTEDTTLTASGNVISDDDGNGVDSDPDNDPLTVSQVNGSATDVGQSVANPGGYGSVTINADGSYIYNLDNTNATVQALNDGETLSDTFTYEVSDGRGGTATASLVVTIRGTTDTAPPNPDAEIFYTVDPATGLVKLNGDPDTGTAYAWQITSWPGGPKSDPNPSLEAPTSDGLDRAEFTATKSGDYIVSLTVTFSDGSGTSATQTVSVSLSSGGGGGGGGGGGSGCKGGPKKCPDS